jgi:hypothetical protein
MLVFHVYTQQLCIGKLISQECRLLFIFTFDTKTFVVGIITAFRPLEKDSQESNPLLLSKLSFGTVEINPSGCKT